jgi:hypothetical protein
MSDPKQDIVDCLTDTLRQYSLRQHDILQKAFEEGGTALVLQVLDEVRDLEGARFDLIQRKLDTNAANFSKLADAAKAEAKALETDIEKLESVAKVLGTITNLVNLIGRILVRFGL